MAEILEQGRELGTPDETIVSSHYQLGDLEWNLGDMQAAKKEYQSGLELAEQLFDADPADLEARRRVSKGRTVFGDVAMILGDSATAIENFRQSQKVNEALIAEDQTMLSPREISASISIKLATYCFDKEIPMVP